VGLDDTARYGVISPDFGKNNDTVDLQRFFELCRTRTNEPEKIAGKKNGG